MKLSTLKPFHAQWMLNLYNRLTLNDVRKVIENGWKSAGIKDAMSKSVSGLQPLDLFSSVDPLVRSYQEYLPPPLLDDTCSPKFWN